METIKKKKYNLHFFVVSGLMFVALEKKKKKVDMGKVMFQAKKIQLSLRVEKLRQPFFEISENFTLSNFEDQEKGLLKIEQKLLKKYSKYINF